MTVTNAADTVTFNKHKSFKIVPLINNGSFVQFGEYRLLKTLGQGEFGKVKLAVSQQEQKQVAIKFIKKSLLSNADFYSKIYREIELMQVMECQKYIGMVMEYASGGELFERIVERRFLSERESKRYFAQLLFGVRCLHRAGIVHRDLKLENLLLDSRLNIKITDLGFANYIPQTVDGMSGTMRTSCGSPCYAAPELVLSDGYKGEEADVWSLGVILYSMLAGYLPYDDDPHNPGGKNVGRLYKYIVNSKLKFPSHIRNNARDLIRKILCPVPEQRLTLEAIMKHNWISETVDELERELFVERNIGRNFGSIRDRAKSDSAALKAAAKQQQQQMVKTIMLSTTEDVITVEMRVNEVTTKESLLTRLTEEYETHEKTATTAVVVFDNNGKRKTSELNLVKYYLKKLSLVFTSNKSDEDSRTTAKLSIITSFSNNKFTIELKRLNGQQKQFKQLAEEIFQLSNIL